MREDDGSNSDRLVHIQTANEAKTKHKVLL